MRLSLINLHHLSLTALCLVFTMAQVCLAWNGCSIGIDKSSSRHRRLTITLHVPHYLIPILLAASRHRGQSFILDIWRFGLVSLLSFH